MSPTSAERTSLITGGAGFIGSHLTERLVQRGDRVVVIDNLSTGRKSNLHHVDPRRLTFVEADVSVALRDMSPDAFDEIYHLAAAVGVRLVIERPIHTIRTNIDETAAVLEFAARHKTPVLLASSSEVYGKANKTPFAEDDDVVYGPTIYSRWSYAASKAVDEYLALAYHRQRGLPVIVARLFNTVGPRQVGNYGMVLPRFVAAAAAGRTLEVYGDGRQTRCFCDVRDVVAMLIELMANPDSRGRVVNVGSDQPVEIHALAELVVSTLNSPSDTTLLPYEKAFGRDFDDMRDRRPDLQRLGRLVHARARIPLVQTIRDLARALADQTPSTMPGDAG